MKRPQDWDTAVLVAGLLRLAHTFEDIAPITGIPPHALNKMTRADWWPLAVLEAETLERTKILGLARRNIIDLLEACDKTTSRWVFDNLDVMFPLEAPDDGEKTFGFDTMSDEELAAARVKAEVPA